MAEKSKKTSSGKKHKDAVKSGTKHSVSPEIITKALLEYIGSISAKCRASAIFVYADAIEGQLLPLPESLKSKAYYVTRTQAEDEDQQAAGVKYLRVPNVQLSRMGQVKIAIFLALSQGIIKLGDTVVFLSGMAQSGNLDTVIVSQVGREYEMFTTTQSNDQTPRKVRSEVIERVINIATDLGSEGREGKPVGSLFVIGDIDRVVSLTRQLVLNPFRGYPEKDRNVLDESFEETIKEFSTIDGAFIVRGDGTVETCGAYIKTASQAEFELPRGLGARHQAAAAVTAVTDAIAVAVSESTGTVTIFRGGKILTDIEKPRRVGQPAGLSVSADDMAVEG